MKVDEAYDLLRQWDSCSLAIRLEAHDVVLRHLQGAGDSVKLQKVCDAVADVCKSLQMVLGDKAK